MAATKNYIKGTFANNRTNQFGATEINIDFTDEAIEHLKSLPKDAKGNRKITIAPQKDPSKSSVYENTFVPRNTNNGSSSDDLPF